MRYTRARRSSQIEMLVDPTRRAAEYGNTVPSVSVIVPAYCAAKRIGKAIDSILAQAFTDYEIIVINDGSPDTNELESTLSGFSAPIIYLKQQNLGPGAARNAGIREARGEFLAFLDADDYWKSNFLAEQIGFLEHNREIELVYADALIVGSSPLAGRTFMEATPSTGDVTLESLLSARCTIILSGVLARRRSVIAAGMFDETFRHSEDYDLWLRMAKSGSRIAYQRNLLLVRSEHGGGLTANTTQLFESALRVLDKAQRQYDLTESECAALISHRKRLEAYIRLDRGKHDLLLGEFASAAAAFREANEFYRSWKLRLVLLSLRVAPRLLLRIQGVMRPAESRSKRASQVYE